MWVARADARCSALYVRRADNALYAFPLQVPTRGQQIRRAGGVAIWAHRRGAAGDGRPLDAALIAAAPPLAAQLDFRTRTALYLTAVVIVPLIVFVLFVRAYLANRLETEYVERGQTALNAAQRVIEDYLASSTPCAAGAGARRRGPELAGARDRPRPASLSRRAARRLEPARSLRRARRVGAAARRRLSAIVLRGKQIVRAPRAPARRSTSRSTARSTSGRGRATRWRCRSSCRGGRSRRR